MKKNLSRILVPVEFAKRDDWAIAKAIELANTFQCQLHLVHVVGMTALQYLPIESGYLVSYDDYAERRTAAEKLCSFKSLYSAHLCNESHIEVSVLQGHAGKELANYVEQYGIDLVIVGQSHLPVLQWFRSRYSMSQLTRQTGVAVLTVKANGLVHHFKKIILPLSDKVPVGRIKMAVMLGRYFKSTIYLLAIRDAEGVYNLPVITQTLEALQSITTIPVQSILLDGKNLAQSTLTFARRINADLIMIHPVKEFFMPGFWSRLTKNLLSASSRIPVLTLDYYPDKEEAAV